MHISVRAPLLSAALSMVRIWIMAGSSARARALENLEQPPRLAPRQRAARRDADEVALAALALLVVRQQLGRAADVLAVLRMLHEPLDLDRDRFLHLVAGDAARERSLTRRRRAVALFRSLGHGSLPLLRAGVRSRRPLLVLHGLEARDVPPHRRPLVGLGQ